MVAHASPEKVGVSVGDTSVLKRAAAWTGALVMAGATVIGLPPAAGASVHLTAAKWIDDGGPQAPVDAVKKAAGGKNGNAAALTGAGIGVALIDSGVAPVTGLNQAGKVVNGPDLSFESQT